MITAIIDDDWLIVKENEECMNYQLVKCEAGRKILRNGVECGTVSYIPHKQQDKLLYWNIKGKINHFGLELVFDSVDFNNIVLRKFVPKPKRYRLVKRLSTYQVVRGS